MRYIQYILCNTVPLAVLLLAQVAGAQSDLFVDNPLAFDSISEAVSGFLRALVMIALPIISLFIVYSGFLFIQAQGNQEQLSKAKTNLFYVLIGSILILGAWVLATLIGGTVSQLVR